MNIKTHTAGLSYESDEKILTPNWIPLKELPKWNLLFLNPNQSHQRLKKSAPSKVQPNRPLDLAALDWSSK